MLVLWQNSLIRIVLLPSTLPVSTNVHSCCHKHDYREATLSLHDGAFICRCVCWYFTISFFGRSLHRRTGKTLRSYMSDIGELTASNRKLPVINSLNNAEIRMKSSQSPDEHSPANKNAVDGIMTTPTFVARRLHAYHCETLLLFAEAIFALAGGLITSTGQNGFWHVDIRLIIAYFNSCVSGAHAAYRPDCTRCVAAGRHDRKGVNIRKTRLLFVTWRPPLTFP